MARFHEITELPRPDTLDPTTPEFQAIVDQAEALFRSDTTAAWIARLRAAGYPCSRYNLPYEAVEDAQVEANDYVVDLEHPTFGGYRTVGMPFAMSETPAVVTKPSPRLDEHTDTMLTELGFDSDAIAELRSAGVVGRAG